MDVNLRKANAFQNEVKSALSDLKIVTSITLNEFEDPTSVIETAGAENVKARASWMSLTAAYFEIRRLTSSANATAGISDTLAHIAQIDSTMTMLRSQGGSSALQLDDAVLKGRIGKLKNPAKDTALHYAHREDIVTTGILSKHQIDTDSAEIKTLSRDKRKMQDDLLNLNVNRTITLSAASVSALKDAGIL